jgi:hypothetical protein
MQKINHACFFPYFSIMHLSSGTMAEWSIARACKALKSSVQIRLVPPNKILIANSIGIFFSSFFMNTFTRTVVEPLTSKSKVKFFWDFKAELKKTLQEVEKVLIQRVEEEYTLDFVDVGNNDIRIRVRDEDLNSQKIVSAIFRFHHDDEKYGNVHIEILVSELSEKNQSQFLGKYLVTNRKKIVPDVVNMMLRGIRAK